MRHLPPEREAAAGARILRHIRHDRHAAFDGPLFVTYTCVGNHALVTELTAMNVSAGSTPGADAWAAQFDASLRSECKRVRESLAANQAHWEKAEAELDQQIQSLAEELETHQGEAAARIRELETRLAKSGERVAGSGESDGEEAGVGDDLRRRYEMALDDIRELTARTANCNSRSPNSARQIQTTSPRTARPAAGSTGRPRKRGSWPCSKPTPKTRRNGIPSG